MKFRHECKHEINYSDKLLLRSRLNAVMQKDSHSVDGKYEIRSLYFDTPDNKALREKADGVNIRDKYRIRFYNGDTSYISLEKKSKVNGLCSKQSCQLSKEEAQSIVDGDISWLRDDNRPLCTELYFQMKSIGLAPKTIVDYTREAFTFPAGNVRVTLDYNIRTGTFRTDFLNPDVVMLPAGESHIILEVKWDEFLPDIIRDAINIQGRTLGSFSKYEQCRIYG